tara:strand:- start:314 stop:508 length:195 start_codon:yes stop_codon:yes gene_type:complete
MTTFILILVIIGIWYLGKYAIEEGVRVEQQKKFMEDMNKWDNGRSENDPVNVWNKHKRKKNEKK